MRCMAKDVKDFDHPEHPFYEKGYPHDTKPEMPKNFSIVASTKESHEALGKDIKAAGFEPAELSENSGIGAYLIEHDGSEKNSKAIHDLSVKHSDGMSLHGNEDGRIVRVEPEGEVTEMEMIHGPHLKDHARLKSGHKVKFVPKQDDVKKSFTQADGESLTDVKSHQAATGPIPKALMDWGSEKLVPMKKDGIEILELNGHIIRVRKLLADLYSGWIEHDGQKIHQFEKVTMPEMLAQLQSKLEMYGKEDQVVAEKKNAEATISAPAKDMVEEHEKLVNVLEHPTPENVEEEAQEQKKELAAYRMVDQKLKDLHQKLKGVGSDTQAAVHIAGKDLVDGLENPEQECSACERPVEDCCCYLGLPKPRVEFDGKKLTIFFKSEWSQEDKENFSTDLKRRAGRILEDRRIEKAKTALSEIRKRK